MTDKLNHQSDGLVGSHLHKRWGATIGLDDMSVNVGPGELVAVIGPSGSGKSTLIRALSLLDPPDSGLITLDGQPLVTMGAEVWPTISVVFQQLYLWPHLTLLENVLLAPRLIGLTDDVGDELIEIASRLAVADCLARFPNEASLGQRQRVALLRALVLKPKFLLLDEVTSALDVESIKRVLDIMDELRTQRLGVLIVTHLLGIAARSDRVIIIDHGRAVETGGPSILKKPATERAREFLSFLA